MRQPSIMMSPRGVRLDPSSLARFVDEWPSLTAKTTLDVRDTSSVRTVTYDNRYGHGFETPAIRGVHTHTHSDSGGSLSCPTVCAR